MYRSSTEFGPGKPYSDKHRTIATINVFPDNVLLEIFDLCQQHDPHRLVWKWHVLAHVCHRWRQIVFSSPTRLNLQILCTQRTPVRKNLDIWPTLPLILRYEGYEYPIDEDDIFAALENPSRVCDVRLHVTGPQLGRIATVLQEPFPALTHLLVWSNDGDVPILPVEFLARSAPSLKAIILTRIPFPTLPLLLPSTSNLVTLELRKIPQTGYISPEAMVTGLATLTRLKYLSIQFQSPASLPNRMRLPPAIRTVLPTLTSLYFSGVREYLEDFVARIDAPRLDSIWIYYFNQLIDFEVTQLSRFIDHPKGLKRPMRCIVEFLSNRISFRAGSHFYPRILQWFSLSYRSLHRLRRIRLANFAPHSGSPSNISCTLQHHPFRRRLRPRNIQIRDYGQYRMAATLEPVLLRADTFCAQPICWARCPGTRRHRRDDCHRSVTSP